VLDSNPHSRDEAILKVLHDALYLLQVIKLAMILALCLLPRPTGKLVLRLTQDGR
jgi:hypothetical protein